MSASLIKEFVLYEQREKLTTKISAWMLDKQVMLTSIHQVASTTGRRTLLYVWQTRTDGWETSHKTQACSEDGGNIGLK